MQVARFLIAYGMVSVLGVLVSLFLAQNTQAERLTFFGQEVSTSLAWIIVGATVAGFLFALLLLLPGRIAATLHIWTLRRETRDLDEELVWQSEQRDQLLAHHEQLLTGHEWLLSAYRRTRGELDHIVSERNALKVQLATVQDTLADQRAALARQQTTLPAFSRQLEGIPVAAAPHAQVEHRSPVAVALDETEVLQEVIEQTTLPRRALAARAPQQVIEQAHAIVVEPEPTSGGAEAVHSSVSFGEALASRARWCMSRYDAWRQELQAVLRDLYAQGAHRADQARDQVRRLASAGWTFVKERASGLGTRAVDERQRVSPVTRPK